MKSLEQIKYDEGKIVVEITVAELARLQTAAQKVVSVGRGHAGKERYILIEAAIKELEAALKAGAK
jgi:electron transfer flavoprotein alpha subunit